MTVETLIQVESQDERVRAVCESVSLPPSVVVMIRECLRESLARERTSENPPANLGREVGRS
jgi:hypothetical protein